MFVCVESPRHMAERGEGWLVGGISPSADRRQVMRSLSRLKREGQQLIRKDRDVCLIT